MLAAARCLAVNSILKSTKGTLDCSFGSDIYKKYGIKDDTDTSRPIGNFSPDGVLEFLDQLNLVSTCSGWATIQVLKLNNHSITSEYTPVLEKLFTLLPTLRPSVIELKGTTPLDMAEISPAIQKIYSASSSPKPKISFTNVLPNNSRLGAVSGMKNRFSNENSNEELNARRVRGRLGTRRNGSRTLGSSAESLAATQYSLANAMRRRNLSAAQQSVANAARSALVSTNLPNTGPTHNPFKVTPNQSSSAAPKKKGLWPFSGGRRKTQKRSKKLKRRSRKVRR